jgi:multidrug efflux pump subunit AcrB
MESFSSMLIGFSIACLAMFVLLTLEFRSYLQPAIIMSIIPFGFIGAVFGHAILGLDMTLFSMFGLIALTGVIVNDSIVLVDFINHRVRDGVPLYDALIETGRRRFRPVMLTSVTTVAGLFPMLLETSLQAQVLIPMAASLVFGLLTGTVLILVLVPVFYQIYGIVTGVENRDIAPDDYEASLAEGSATAVLAAR